jgi:hypothetical protein
MQLIAIRRSWSVGLTLAAVALGADSSAPKVSAKAAEPAAWPTEGSPNFPQGGQHVRDVRLLKMEGAESGRATAVLRVGDSIFLGGTEFSHETSSRLWVWKLNLSGDVLWRTRLTPPQGLDGGGGGPNLVGILSNADGSVRAVASWAQRPRMANTYAVDIEDSGVVKRTIPLGTFHLHRGLVADGAGGAFFFGDGKTDAWVGRFDQDAKMLWEKRYSPQRQGDATEKAADELAKASGFSHATYLLDGELLDDGSAVLIGMSGASNKFGPGVAKLWLLRVGADGEKLTETLIDGGRVWPGNDSITRHGDGVLAAYMGKQSPPINRIPRGSPPELRTTVAKFDLRLQREWAKPGGFTSLLGASSINGDGPTIAGPTIMVGESHRDVPVWGLDADGDIAWKTKIATGDAFVMPFTTLRQDDDAMVIANYRISGRSGDRGVGMLLAWVAPPKVD